MAKEITWLQEATEWVVAKLRSETSFPGFYAEESERLLSTCIVLDVAVYREASVGPCDTHHLGFI